MTEPSDRRRALDLVEPSGSWGDVVARAARPELVELEPLETGRARRPLLVAAAVLLVAGLFGAALVAADSEGGGPSLRTGAPAHDPPGEIWGRTWKVTRLEVEQVDRPASVEGEPVVLDLSLRGEVSFEVCNRNTISVSPDGDRLLFRGIGGTLTACRGGRGDLDLRIGRIFRADPLVELRGDHLTLTGDNSSIELVDVTPPAADAALDSPSEIWGRRSWKLGGITVDGIRLNLAPAPGDGQYVLSTAVEGSLVIDGCNRISSSGVRIEGNRLARADVTIENGRCTGAAGEAWMRQDEVIQRVLSGAPQVTVLGPFLYLVAGSDELTFWGLTEGADTTTTTTEP